MGSQKRGSDDVFHSGPNTVCGREEVARVFTPDRTKSGLDQVPGGNSGQAHAVAFRKTVPVRAVFRRNVAGSSDGGTEWTRQKKTGGSDSRCHNPVRALRRLNGLVIGDGNGSAGSIRQ